jgi:tryptophanyl-tRNA synthetase
MKTISDAIKVLEDNKIKYEILSIKSDTYTVDVQVKELGINFSEGLSTLLFKNENEDLIVFLRRDDRNVDLNALCKATNSKILRMCEEEDLTKYGFQKLLLSPILLPKELGKKLKVYIDSSVMQNKTVVVGSTDKKQCLRLELKDLLTIIGKYEVVSATVANENRQDKLNFTRVLDGITPSGANMHIGNYFGAIGPNIKLQDEVKEPYFFIADVHALTTVKDAKQLENNIVNIVLDYLALGLDPNKAVFFRQSEVPEHMYLNTVLANYISYGHMQRMHAFKDKMAKNFDESQVNMGLFNYPILMAADILLYNPDAVPVGEDQRQHVELTRDIAESFNKTVGKDVFKLPVPYISEVTGRLVGTDGTRKMSKSLGNVIGIFDDYEVIKKQIFGSYTDPNRLKATDPGRVEGNPIFIYHDLINDNETEVADLKARYLEGKVGDVEVKQKLLEAHMRKFAAAREKRKELEKNMDYVKKILENGAKKARVEASRTLGEVLKVIGLNNILN